VTFQANQAIKGVIFRWDAVVELLNSIKDLLDRLDIYTWIPRAPFMDKIVIRITAELLSTLALATRDLRQGRSSESILADT
jgi:hypothetical protein